MNNDQDYIVAQQLIELLKRNIGITVKDRLLDVLVTNKNKTVTITKQLNATTRQVTNQYR